MFKKLMIVVGVATVQCAIGSTITTVDLSRLSFNPTPLTVNVGDTVVFHNADTFPQVLQTSGTSNQFLSPVLLQGQDFSFTFQNPGVDFYQNLVNPGITGAVVVGPATGPARIDVNLTVSSIDLNPLTVFVGDTVVWHTADRIPIVIATTPASSIQFLGPVTLPGQEFAFTFQSPGQVLYQNLVSTIGTDRITVLDAPAPPPAPAPEGTSFGLAGVGLLALVFIRRFRTTPA
jgi:plastocyanin